MNNQNCPICNSLGLPNYTKEHVICPQCNSDLKAFMLLESISKPQNSKTGIFVIVGISLLSIGLLGLYLKSNSDRTELSAQNTILIDSISNMQNDTITKGTEKVLTQPSAEEQNVFVIVEYVVKKGDYLSKIAEFFYNDGNKYKQIGEDNGLKHPYTLKVGQVLKIKILLN